MARSVDFSLYLVTDPHLAGARSVVDTVAEAIKGGVTIVQLRDPHATGRALVETARALKLLLAPHAIPLIINDRVDVAIAANADGVHVGQRDIDPRDVRRMIGPDRILGLSVGTATEWDDSAAMLGVVDYLGTGPITATATKADAGPAIGLDGLKAIVARTQLPVVAIGGINLANAAKAIHAGASGIAVVSAIVAADDPAEAARALRDDVRAALTERTGAR